MIRSNLCFKKISLYNLGKMDFRISRMEKRGNWKAFLNIPRETMVGFR